MTRWGLRGAFVLFLVVSLLGCTAATLPAPHAQREISAAANPRVLETYGRLPLTFEANQGQTDSQVRFLSRGRGYTFLLTTTEAVLALREPRTPGQADRSQKGLLLPDERSPENTLGMVMRMTFAGANPTPRVTGLEELAGKANYFIGNDPAKWRPNVPTYAKVQYSDLYPGIDLIYYGTERQLEYDFVVQAGADPKQIVLTFQGADRLEVDACGDLVLHTSAGAIRQRKPVIHQEVGGVRTEIPGGYVLTGKHQVGFRITAYDASRPLVIDPVLSYSTYLGGSGSDEGSGIAVDARGSAYVTGQTESPDFPTTAGAFNTTRDFRDAFVTKLDPTGSALVYSTYLGGSGADAGFGIVVDASGNAYVTGSTSSSTFPTTTGAFQQTFGGAGDAFMTKLNSTGSTLVYSTYLGGSGADAGFGIVVDASGNAYVTGFTNSPNFPTTAGALQRTFGGGFGDAFVTKLDLIGSTLVYSTYLGGRSELCCSSELGFGIAVDALGNAYVTGRTNSTNFPTTDGAFDTTLGGFNNAFVTKLDPTGSALVYSTYLGGSNADEGSGIAVDASGNAYVTGQTFSTDFPTTMGAFDITLGGGSGDAFVTKLGAAGSTLAYSTYLGGSFDTEQGFGIAVDALGNAYVTGFTDSPDFPTTAGAFDTTFNIFRDAFVTKLDPTGSALVYSTYLGGSEQEEGRGIAVDALGNAYVTGRTRSSNFPTTAGAFDTTFGGGVFNAFVTKTVLEPDNRLPVANAGADQAVECSGPAGTPVTLNGSGSSDPDGDPLTYTWREGGSLVAGPSATPTSQVPLALGSHTIELTVADGKGGVARDEVTATVQDNTPPQVTARLERIHRGDDPDDQRDAESGWTLFGVVASATDACHSGPGVQANINGVTVANGQLVRLRLDDDTETVKFRNGLLWIKAPLITLTVRATDGSGGTATAIAKLEAERERRDRGDRTEHRPGKGGGDAGASRR